MHLKIQRKLVVVYLGMFYALRKVGIKEKLDQSHLQFTLIDDYLVRIVYINRCSVIRGKQKEDSKFKFQSVKKTVHANNETASL